MPTDRPTVSAPTPEALEEAADFLVRCRGTEAWEIYEGHAAMVRAAAARIRELEEAIEKRRQAGHNDTCGAMLRCDTCRVPDLHDECSCGHSDLVRLLAHNESEDRNG